MPRRELIALGRDENGEFAVGVEGVLIQFRRSTSAEWAQINPTLEDAEPGYETDTRRIKVGPGRWNDLPYRFEEDWPKVAYQSASSQIVTCGAQDVANLAPGESVTIKDGFVIYTVTREPQTDVPLIVRK